MPNDGREQVFSEAEIIKKLQDEYPKWTFFDGHICRVYKTHNWKSTLMVVNTVGHLAEVAWHHPDMRVSLQAVEVRLMNHAAKGVTGKDFELARKLDEVICWRPDREDGALTGTPEAARFAYIDHDT